MLITMKEIIKINRNQNILTTNESMKKIYIFLYLYIIEL
jgi:hypothetical protein